MIPNALIPNNNIKDENRWTKSLHYLEKKDKINQNKLWKKIIKIKAKFSKVKTANK